MQKIIISIILIFSLSGCSFVKSNENSFKLKYFHSTEVTDFHLLTQELLGNLSDTILEIKAKKRRISPLYVTDFVNIDNLENKSQLGFILSDELKTNITQDVNWPIYQIEFAKYLKVGERGSKLLSRDISELKYKNIDDNTYALVGTYAITQRQLLVYLKLINLKNGVILKSSTKRVTLTDEILKLDQKKKKPKKQIVYQPVVI